MGAEGFRIRGAPGRVLFSWGKKKLNAYAAIDVGTNSVRLLVAELAGGRITPVYWTLRATRLGERLTEDFTLKPPAISRTLGALEELRQIAERFKPKQLRVVGTSALRVATNREDFLTRAHYLLGQPVRVLTGEEEARLGYMGARSALGVGPGYLYCDIGGGSTEFVAERNGFYVVSAPLGAVVVYEEGWDDASVRREIQAALNGLPPGAEGVIGVGGTITSLAAIDQELVVYDPGKVHGYRLSEYRIRSIYDYLSNLTVDQRRRVAGLQPERADIIVAGALILKEILACVGQTEVLVSEADLLHGVIIMSAGETGEYRT